MSFLLHLPTHIHTQKPGTVFLSYIKGNIVDAHQPKNGTSGDGVMKGKVIIQSQRAKSNHDITV